MAKKCSPPALGVDAIRMEGVLHKPLFLPQVQTQLKTPEHPATVLVQAVCLCDCCRACIREERCEHYTCTPVPICSAALHIIRQAAEHAKRRGGYSHMTHCSLPASPAQVQHRCAVGSVPLSSTVIVGCADMRAPSAGGVTSSTDPRQVPRAGSLPRNCSSGPATLSCSRVPGTCARDAYCVKT